MDVLPNLQKGGGGLLFFTFQYFGATYCSQCDLQCKRSTTDQIFCICQIQKNGRVHQLFIDSEKAYGLVMREILYNTVTEFGIPTKLLRLISVFKTNSKVCIGKHLSDAFPNQNGMK
jgi:hypothetical protein